MAYTYQQGNTVRNFLGGDHANADVTRLLTADEYGNQFNPLYGMSPFDYLRSMGVDPTNMNALVPDPMDRPDVSGNAVMAILGAAMGAGIGAGFGAGAAGTEGTMGAGLGAGESVSGSYGATAGELSSAASSYGAGLGAEGTMGAGGTGMSGSLWTDIPGWDQSLTGAFDQFGSLGTPAVQGVGGLGYLPADLGSYMSTTGSGLFSALSGMPGLSGLSPDLLKLLQGGSGTGGQTDIAKLLAGLGSGAGGLGGLLGLAAREAPGLAALAYAGQQKPVDQSGLQGVASAAGQPLPGIDTSQLQALLGRAQQPLGQVDMSGLQSTLQQAQANSPMFIQSMLHPAQQAMARGYGDMLQSQGQRGVRGSSFGDQQITNYLTDQSRTLGDIGAQATQTALGLQGNLGGQIANVGLAERGQQLQQLGLENTAANNLANIGLTQNQQAISKLGVQGNIASQLASLGLQQQAVQNAMYGRAFDILGRGLSPTGQSSFGGTSGGSDIMSLLQSLGLGGP